MYQQSVFTISNNKPKGYNDKTYILNSSGQCAMYFLIPLCLIFMAAAAAIIGVVIWMFVEGLFMAVLASSLVLSASIILWIITGIVLLFIAILGLIAAGTKSKLVTVLYIAILSLLLLSLLVVGILALSFRGEMDERVRGEMLNMIRDKYGIRQGVPQYDRVTKAWDRVQLLLDCCGVDRSGFDVYRESKWYAEQPGVVEANKPFVPVSCCAQDQYHKYIDVEKCQLFKEGPPNTQGGVSNEALNVRGCYEASRQFVEERTSVIAGFGFAMAAVLIFGVICGVIFYINLKRSSS